jgi:nucleoside-diphosphate-sugar epimerase
MNVIQEDKYDTLPWPTPTRDQGLRFGLWPYVGVHDAATACRLALEAETHGHEVFWIAAQDIRFDVDTEKLLGEFAPQVEIRQPLPDPSGVISIEKARRLIGYEPKFSWRKS